MENKQLTEWIKPGIYNGLQKISIPLFGVLTTALLAHKALTKSEMGVWVNFLALTAFVEMFRAGIVRTSLIKYINFADKDAHIQIKSAAFVLNVVVSLVAAILLISTSHLVENFLKSPGLAQILDVYAFILVALIFFSHLEWLMFAYLDFKSLFYSYMVRQGSTLLGIFIYYLSAEKTKLEGLVFIYAGGIVLGTLMAFFLLRKMFTIKFIYSMHWIKTLWNFGKFVFGSNISTLVFKSADQFLLSNISANPAAVASQNISRRVINIADIPSQVVGDILFPKNSSSDLTVNKSMTKFYYEKAVGASLSIILPIMIVLLVFPKYIILVLAGSDYLDAVPYLRLISITIFFQAYLKQFGVIMDSSGFPNVNFRVVSFIALSTIVFCYLTIPKYELMGAAYALLLAYLTGFILSMFILFRYFQITIAGTLRYCLQFYPEMFQILRAALKKRNNQKPE